METIFEQNFDHIPKFGVVLGNRVVFGVFFWQLLQSIEPKEIRNRAQAFVLLVFAIFFISVLYFFS